MNFAIVYCNSLCISNIKTRNLYITKKIITKKIPNSFRYGYMRLNLSTGQSIKCTSPESKTLPTNLRNHLYCHNYCCRNLRLSNIIGQSKILGNSYMVDRDSHVASCSRSTRPNTMKLSYRYNTCLVGICLLLSTTTSVLASHQPSKFLGR